MQQPTKSLSVYGKKDAKKLSGEGLDAIEFLHIQKASELDVPYAHFTAVKEMWISSKEDYQLPDSLVTLQQLDKLIVDEHCLLPNDIHVLKNLRELWLSNKGILHPPKNITRLASLRELHIYFYDKVEPTPAPEWIFEMEQLSKLRFSVCRFSSISQNINRLAGLTHLDFGCSLSDLEAFPNLSGLAGLKELSVEGRSVQGQRMPPYALFSQVLAGIKQLQSLESLNLSGWRPKKKAEWLVEVAKKHSIPDIFDSFPNLKELLLCEMGLDFVPNSILQLKTLEKLVIIQNKLANEDIRQLIHHLPGCRIDSDVVYYKPQKK